MSYYPDLRSFIDLLEEEGKLYRYKDPIDKDRMLLPLVRVQQRGVQPADRKVFLFDDVRNAAGERYDIGVVEGVYGLTPELVLWGIGCKTHAEALERFHRALDKPIPTELVDSGPAQEVIHVGDDLRARGLDALPVPVEEPGFSEMIRTGLPVISRDPETCVRNSGTYNGFLRDRTRMVCGAGPSRHLGRHWTTAKRRNEDLPVAIVLERNYLPEMRVTAITHRKDALFTPVLVGYPPVEASTISSVCLAGMLNHYLKYVCRLPIEDIGVNEMGGTSSFAIIRLEKNARANTWQILQAAASFWSFGKYLILVDYDINPHDSDMLMWALSFRVQPEKDILIERGRWPGLDPSWGPTGASQGMMTPPGGPRDYFRVLIDATVKGSYPPVALPRREFMEAALEVWKQHPDLPQLALREPWYGYTLGYWTDEDQKLADLIAKGDYRAVGRYAKDLQKSVNEASPE